MKKLFILLSLVFIAKISFAEQVISTEYEFYDRKENDYSSIKMTYSLRMGANMASLKYSTYLGEDDDMRLQEASLAYFHFGDKHLFGGFAGSSSDKPFNTANLMNAVALYGYSVYSKVLEEREVTLPDGRKFPFYRKSRLYLGIAVASQPVFLNTYFFPLVSYSYMGKNFHLRLGVPSNGITFTPSEMHKIDIDISLSDNYKITYAFAPTEADTATLFYGKEIEGYVLSEYDDRDKTLWYQKEWIRLSYEHIFFDFLGVEASTGYMLSGNYYLGDYFRKKGNMKLPNQYLFGVKLSAYF
ncbi:MAG: hypothetical protein LBD73_08425 [Deferribacteraceae bacterium]|jgi:hypothetical protein|nr:hypothetical protein [Deferribacteraceae bacterium]